LTNLLTFYHIPAHETTFLCFLEKNNALYKDGKTRINNDALATLTILVATSRPEDKDIMMQLIKTIIKWEIFNMYNK